MGTRTMQIGRIFTDFKIKISVKIRPICVVRVPIVIQLARIQLAFSKYQFTSKKGSFKKQIDSKKERV